MSRTCGAARSRSAGTRTRCQPTSSKCSRTEGAAGDGKCPLAVQGAERDEGDAEGGRDERKTPEERRAGQQRDRAEDDRDLEADFSAVVKRRAVSGRFRVRVELLIGLADVFGLLALVFTFLFPLGGRFRALRSDELRELRVGRVHV